MHFLSAPFAFFLLLVLTGAWLLRPFKTAHKVFLLLASYAFYARLELGLVLLASSLVNWGFGAWLFRLTGERAKRGVLWIAVGANLSLLGGFKYYGLFRETASLVASVFGLQMHLPLLEVAVPVGISFFSFQGLSYVIDLSRRTLPRPAGLLDFLLFIAFFPKLLAGPLCRPKDLLPQLQAGPPERIADLSGALGLLASGLFKKAVLATFLGQALVDDAFLAPENHSAVELWIALYAYSIQLYCDFSGYSDMAQGVAALLGYKLPDNFRAPYAATDLGDFWRRWHITFSTWLREYVYFPLGGSRGGLSRTCLNLLVTFTLCGLWHGASWGFVLWGAAHGVMLCLHKLLRDGRKWLRIDGRDPLPYLLLCWFVTFHAVVLSRLLFRAPDLSTAQSFAERIFAFAPGPFASLPVLIACALGLSLHFLGARLRDAFVWTHGKTPLPALPVLWTAVVVLVLALQPGGVAPYIYFQF